MQTSIDIIDSIVICKGSLGYYAYLRFADKFYDKDYASDSLETLHHHIDNYLFKTFRIKTR